MTKLDRKQLSKSMKTSDGVAGTKIFNFDQTSSGHGCAAEKLVEAADLEGSLVSS